jgi:hypothetical protein
VPPFLNKTFIGIPIWGWGLGLAALAAGLWYFSRQKSGTVTSANQAGTIAPSGAVPVPFPTSNQVSGSPPQAQVPTQIHMRSRRPNTEWDWPNGPPVFKDPMNPWGSVVGYAPYQNPETFTGQVKQGGSIAGNVNYDQIVLPGGSFGYVSATDAILDTGPIVTQGQTFGQIVQPV